MLIDDLAHRIWINSEFKAEYVDLLLESIGQGIGLTPAPRKKDWRESLRRLLQSASHFAATSSTMYREAAYRIVAATYSLYRLDYENILDAMSFVLGRLGNFPATNLLYGTGEHQAYDSLPQALWFEIESRQLSNSVRVNGHSEILTDFQKRLWDSLESKVSTAVTAPTSAGKSFALQRFLAKFFLTEGGWAVYVVPTRALLNQVADNLTDLLGSFGLTDKVFTIPVAPSELNATGGVYVLTQERLQLLLESDPNLAFSLVIIDEAQILSEGGRGVILEVVVEKLRRRRSEIQFLFGSPQTRNPGVFQHAFSLLQLNVVQELETPVAQNILFVDTDPVRLSEATLTALVDGERRFVSRLTAGFVLR